MCYCEHCRENFHAGQRHGPAAHHQPAGPGAPRLHRLAAAAPVRAVAPVGRRDPQDQPRRPLHPQRRRRRTERSRHEDHRRDWRRFCSPTARRAAASLPRGPTARTARSTAPPWARKPIGGIFSVGVEEPYRWKDSVQSGPEIRLWALDGIANGLRPWFTKFSGTLHDRRWLQPVEEVYTWHYRNERYLRNEQPLARVAMVYSQQTAQFYGGEQRAAESGRPHPGLLPGADRSAHSVRDGARPAARRRARGPVQGADPAQHRGAFRRRSAARSASMWRAAAASWPRTKLRSTTSGACAARDFGLADLFGASFDGAIDARMQNSYLRLEAGAASASWPDWKTPRASSTASRACTPGPSERIPIRR